MSNVMGVLIAMLIGILGIPTFIHWEQVGIDNAKLAATAQGLKEFDDAVQQYVLANAVAIEGVATSTVPATITVGMLQATLPLRRLTGANAYGQIWQAQILQPLPGQFEILVLGQGGTPLSPDQQSRLAILAGESKVGFIPYPNEFGASTCASVGTPCMMGALSSWQISMVHYTNPGPGHAGSLLYYNNGSIASYLYRNAVPGNPSANTMSTPLIMGATATVGAACSTTGAIAQDGTGSLLSCPTSGNWTPVGGGSWKSPVANYASLPATGNALGDVRLTTDVNRAYAWNGMSWVALAVDQNGYLQIPGIATVGAACSSNGLIAQDGTGLILSCQSGVWGSPSVATVAHVGTGTLAKYFASLQTVTEYYNVCSGGSFPAYFNTDASLNLYVAGTYWGSIASGTLVDGYGDVITLTLAGLLVTYPACSTATLFPWK